MTTDRIGPPLTGRERETLRAHLDVHRATLMQKCDGLSDEDLRRRSVPPSALSLLGLVRHLAEVERSWFGRVADGEDVPLVWSADGDFQAAHEQPRPPGRRRSRRGSARSNTPAGSSAPRRRSTRPGSTG